MKAPYKHTIAHLHVVLYKYYIFVLQFYCY